MHVTRLQCHCTQTGAGRNAKGKATGVITADAKHNKGTLSLTSLRITAKDIYYSPAYFSPANAGLGN